MDELISNIISRLLEVVSLKSFVEKLIYVEFSNYTYKFSFNIEYTDEFNF